MMNSELPVVAKRVIRGETITVRAVPYGLAEKLANASGNSGEAMNVSRKIVETCCFMENGEAIDCNMLTVKEATDLVNKACDPEADADFQQPSEG